MVRLNADVVQPPFDPRFGSFERVRANR